MRFSDRILDVDFGENIFEKLIAHLKPGQPLTAGAVLTALCSEGEVESFEQMDLLAVPLDISDLPKATAAGQVALRLRLEHQLVQENRLPEGLEENDPLRLYLEELASIPVCGDVALLAQQLFTANREERKASELYKKLLDLSLGRIVEIAKEYTGYGVSLLDLIQEGSMYLWQYLPSFQGETGKDFEKLRDHCVHHAMKKTLILQAHANGVGQKLRQALEDYRDADEKLLVELGRNPTVEEIADSLHVTAEETALIASMLERINTLNRATAQPEPQPEEDDQAVEDTAYFQTRQRIAELLSGLNEQEAKLLTLRFGLEGGLPLSPEDTGKRLGLTREEVVAMEAATLQKLRN